VARGQANYWRRFIPLKERFLENVAVVTESGCWIWTGRLSDDGYGEFSIKGNKVRAHRAAWGIFKGESPAGRVVCHSCDVPCCVNPAHLFLGDVAANVRDMHAKGRNADIRGTRNAQAKLTEANVRSIRASTQPLKVLAAQFGVSEASISLIRNRINWSHLP
jgi:HNH endonuclease